MIKHETHTDYRLPIITKIVKYIRDGVSTSGQTVNKGKTLVIVPRIFPIILFSDFIFEHIQYRISR